MTTESQPLLPGLPDAIVSEIHRMDTDRLVARCVELLEFITPAPWTHCGHEKLGRNWTIASFGADAKGRKWLLTTEHIRASEMYGDARVDAEFCAIARVLLPRLIEHWKADGKR